MTLRTEFNLGSAGDDLYAALIEAHHGLTDSESAALNARLVLILINHIGDETIIREAILTAARDNRKSTGGGDGQPSVT